MIIQSFDIFVNYGHKMETIISIFPTFNDYFGDNQVSDTLIVEGEECEGVVNCVWESMSDIWSEVQQMELPKSVQEVQTCTNIISLIMILIQVPALVTVVASWAITIVVR